MCLAFTEHSSVPALMDGPRSSELLLQIQLEQRGNHGRPCEYLDADAFTLSLRASVVISLVFDFSLGPNFKCSTPGLRCPAERSLLGVGTILNESRSGYVVA